LRGWQQSEDDLWGPIEPRLHVCIGLLSSEATRTEIHELKAVLLAFLLNDQDIFRLEIAMNDFVSLQEY
jgi:hypothetical protein